MAAIYTLQPFLKPLFLGLYSRFQSISGPAWGLSITCQNSLQRFKAVLSVWILIPWFIRKCYDYLLVSGTYNGKGTLFIRKRFDLGGLAVILDS